MTSDPLTAARRSHQTPCGGADLGAAAGSRLARHGARRGACASRATQHSAQSCVEGGCSSRASSWIEVQGPGPVPAPLGPRRTTAS